MDSLIHFELLLTIVMLSSNMNVLCNNAIRHRSITRRKLLQKVHFKYVLYSCGVPIDCHSTLMHELLVKESLSECDGIEYGHLVTCIERNMHGLLKTHRKMAIVGEVCCSTNEAATRWCKAACESAMYAPTLEITERLKRIEYFCDHGIQMDSEVLTCVNMVVESLRGHISPKPNIPE